MALLKKDSADPSHLARIHQLGDLKAIYKPNKTIQSICAFVMIAIGIAWIALSVMLGFLVLFGLLLISIGLFLLVRGNSTARLSAFVYTAGLIYILHSTAQVIRWKDVQTVSHNVIVNIDGNMKYNVSISTSKKVGHFYTITCFNGTSLTLSKKLRDLVELGKTIEIETARYLTPTMLQTYQEHQSVDFGPFTVTSVGLYYENKMLAWVELKQVIIDETNGRISIKRVGYLFNWATVKLAQVPNIEVFRALVKQASGNKVA